jgi:hypothetical protein
VRAAFSFPIYIDFVHGRRISEKDLAILGTYHTMLDICPDLGQQVSWTLDYRFEGLTQLASFVSLLCIPVSDYLLA